MDDAVMNCKEAQRQLLEALRPDTPLPEVEAHLSACPACQAMHGQLARIDRLVRQQRPELPQGFELSLRRRLEQPAARTTRSERPSRRLGLALAAAAALLLTAAVFLATRAGDRATSSHHQVRVTVRTSRDVDDVRFELVLPEGVRLAPSAGAAIGQGDRLRWRSRLRAGLNEIDLPLVSSVARATVRARIAYGAGAIERTVILEGRRAAAAGAPQPPGPARLAWNLEPTAASAGHGTSGSGSARR